MATAVALDVQHFHVHDNKRLVKKLLRWLIPNRSTGTLNLKLHLRVRKRPTWEHSEPPTFPVRIDIKVWLLVNMFC